MAILRRWETVFIIEGVRGVGGFQGSGFRGGERSERRETRERMPLASGPRVRCDGGPRRREIRP